MRYPRYSPRLSFPLLALLCTNARITTRHLARHGRGSATQRRVQSPCSIVASVQTRVMRTPELASEHVPFGPPSIPFSLSFSLSLSPYAVLRDHPCGALRVCQCLTYTTSLRKARLVLPKCAFTSDETPAMLHNPPFCPAPCLSKRLGGSGTTWDHHHHELARHASVFQGQVYAKNIKIHATTIAI